MKMTRYKVTVKDIEANSLVENLGLFRTEAEAVAAGEKYFSDYPIEKDFSEYQIKELTF